MECEYKIEIFFLHPLVTYEGPTFEFHFYCFLSVVLCFCYRFCDFVKSREHMETALPTPHPIGSFDARTMCQPSGRPIRNRRARVGELSPEPKPSQACEGSLS